MIARLVLPALYRRRVAMAVFSLFPGHLIFVLRSIISAIANPIVVVALTLSLYLWLGINHARLIGLGLRQQSVW